MSGATPTTPARWAWADVDLDAVAHNVAVLRRIVAPSDVWAVVKADGYGHGAVPVARTAVAAGAAGLCVALVEEGAALRTAGITAPVLVLSEQPADAAAALVAAELCATVYSTASVDALAAAAAERGVRTPVHLKIDTGMQRVGVAPDGVDAVLDRIDAHAAHVDLTGIFTHLAVADEPDNGFTATQLGRFDDVLERLRRAGRLAPHLAIHAGNSAAALAHPASRRSFVRSGIALYGILPGPGVAERCDELRPALSLRARVSLVKRVRAGTSISYGLRHTFATDSTVATVPIGYADGVPRRLSSTGGEVLIGGRRRPIVGVVTMDQLMVDCGDDHVAVGDEVVLIGEQAGPAGPERIRAEDWGDRLGTIGYEVVCGIGARVPRRTGRSIDRTMVER